MTGKITLIGHDYYVGNEYPMLSEPTRIITLWRVLAHRVTGAGAPELEAGLEVQYLAGSDTTWQAYRQGAYLVLTTEREGQNSTAPIPSPKVRRGIATRYHDGHWQKFTKRGWTAAEKGSR